MHSQRERRRTTVPRRLAAAVLGAVAVGLAAAVATGPAGAAALPAPPPTPAGLPAQIEPLQPYVRASSCTQSSTVGAKKLADLLRDTYGYSSGIARECGSSVSEHFEGRALDFMVSVRSSAGRATAQSLLDWLLATDARGQQYAMTRRLGVMYIIWNDRMWRAYDPGRGWTPYSSCASHPESSYDTTCHRDHVHISLGWAGATGSTSYWTRSVAPVDYGPCRERDLNWASPWGRANPVRCVDHPTVPAPAGASSSTRTLWANSGVVLRSGMTGTVVTAVQKALGTTADGAFGSADVRAVQALQARAGLASSSVLDHPSWRALLGLRQLQPPAPPPPPSPPPAPARRAVAAPGVQLAPAGAQHVRP